MLHFFSRVVTAADEFEPINDLDWVKHFPDVVPELCKISQQCCDEIRVTELAIKIIKCEYKKLNTAALQNKVNKCCKDGLW